MKQEDYINKITLSFANRSIVGFLFINEIILIPLSLFISKSSITYHWMNGLKSFHVILYFLLRKLNNAYDYNPEILFPIDINPQS